MRSLADSACLVCSVSFFYSNLWFPKKGFFKADFHEIVRLVLVGYFAYLSNWSVFLIFIIAN